VECTGIIDSMKSLFLVCALLVGACGHGDGDIDTEVGATCVDDRDCDDSCVLGGDFPGGFCSLPCDTDNDCPGDTYCMETQGGICMFACPAFDCDRLGAGWSCKSRKRNNGGDINVCSG
jgi:hypothetical protein